MDAILNNPYRILGLEPTDDETIISERVSEILRLLTNGEKVSFPIDELYNNILVDPYNTQYYNSLSTNKGEPIPTRNIETVKIAHEKLKDPIKRKYYALFTFYLDDSFNSKETDDIIETLESEFQIEEKRINKFSHTFSSDFLNHYAEVENPDYIIEKENNLLRIENLIENGTFLKPNMGFDLSQLTNFSLDFNCEWIQGNDNSCFSIYWGRDPSRNSCYSFGITGNGQFFLANYEDGIRIKNDIDFIGWKESDAINQFAKNHLEIRKSSDRIEFLYK